MKETRVEGETTQRKSRKRPLLPSSPQPSKKRKLDEGPFNVVALEQLSEEEIQKQRLKVARTFFKYHFYGKRLKRKEEKPKFKKLSPAIPFIRLDHRSKR
eukprot:TRINITY_DN6201_c0_g1_i5.p1 TRINITY_DN6201_c0_g1~~TRINITY_DN6201_c0_g1_i5.p1  ORF type:complete len:100 (-),score=26.32 TRINITY_DN6201_c0_g1_i5:88-387(-)